MVAEDMEAEELVTPGEVLGKSTEVKPGSGAHSDPHNNLVYASLTGRVRTVRPSADSPDQRSTVEVIGQKAHGAVPEPGSVVIARVTKVMARMASADIMCIGPKSVKGEIHWHHKSITATIRLNPIHGYRSVMRGHIICQLRRMNSACYQRRAQHVKQ